MLFRFSYRQEFVVLIILLFHCAIASADATSDSGKTSNIVITTLFSEDVVPPESVVITPENGVAKAKINIISASGIDLVRLPAGTNFETYHVNFSVKSPDKLVVTPTTNAKVKYGDKSESTVNNPTSIIISPKNEASVDINKDTITIKPIAVNSKTELSKYSASVEYGSLALGAESPCSLLIFESCEFSGNGDPIVDSMLVAKSGIAAGSTVEKMISDTQGMSLLSTNKNGKQTGNVTGEMRLRLADKKDFFVYLSSDVNSNDFSKLTLGKITPISPNWISLGGGWNANHIFSTEQKHWYSNSWNSLTVKFGSLENRVYSENLYYTVVNATDTVFISGNDLFNFEFNESQRHPDDKLYFGFTVGGQTQNQHGNGKPSASELQGSTYSISPIFKYGRFDTWWTINSDSNALTRKIASISPTTTSSGVTVHFDENFVNNSMGQLKELSITAPLTKEVKLSFTDSIGVQDPLQYFGVFPPPSYQHVISIGIKLGGGNGN